MSIGGWARTLALLGCAAIGAGCKPKYRSPLGMLPPDGITGTNGSRYFPIAMWTNEAKIAQGGTVPDDPGEAAFYLAETFGQMKRWGINTVTTGGLDPAHAQAVLVAADNARLDVNLGPIDIGVGPSSYFFGCGPMAIPWTPQQVHDVALSQSGLYATAPALIAYQVTDEPPICAYEPQRQLAGWLESFDPAHRAFSALNANLGITYSAADKMLAYDEMVLDPYPLWENNAVDQEPLSLGYFEPALEMNWNAIAPDKPIRAVLQAFSGSPFRPPSQLELRHMTYLALAHGAKGIYYFLYQATGSDYSAVDSDGDRSAVWQCPKCKTQPAQPVRAGAAYVPQLAHELAMLAPWLVDADRDDAHTGRVGGPGCATGAGAGNVFAWAVGAGAADCALYSFQTIFGEKLVLLVNRHTFKRVFNIAVDQSVIPNIVAKGALAVQEVRGGAIITSSVSGSQLQFSDTLDAGDGRLYRLVSPLSADIRITKERILNPVAPGATVTVPAQLLNLGSAAWPASSVHPALKIYPPGSATATVVKGTLAADVAPGAGAAVSVDIPASALAGAGTYTIGFDLVQDGGPFFANEQKTAIMVQPDPLLTDTFDAPPYRRGSDFLARWDRAPRASVRDDRLAGNGGGLMLSHFPDANGTAWSDYSYELDVLIDSPNDLGKAGWAVRASSDGGGSGYIYALCAADSDTPNQIVKWIDRGGTLTPAGSITLGFAIHEGEWHHVRVDAAGGTLSLYLDYTAQPIDVWNDASFASGKVGFYLAEGDDSGVGLWRAHYDNVSVYASATPPAPPVPQLQSVVNVAGPALRLSWTRAVDDTFGGAAIAGYRVYAGATAGGPYTLVAATGALAFVDATPKAGAPVFYVVTAVASGGAESARSNEVVATLATAPAAVTNLTADAGSTMKTMELAWTPPAGSVDHYDIYRSLDPFFPSWSERSRIGSTRGATFEDGTRNSYVDDGAIGLDGLRAYHYAVVAVDAAGNRSPVSDVRGSTFGSNLFNDDFGLFRAGWRQGAGTWKLGDGLYAQTDANAAAWVTLESLPPRSLRGPLRGPAVWGNFTVETTLEALSSGQPGVPSVGLSVHKPDPTLAGGGYEIAYFTDGTITLANPAGAVVATAASGLIPDTLRRLRVSVHGWHLQIYVEGVKLIDWSDPQRPAGRDAGYFDLRTTKTVGQFDTVNVWVRDPFNDGSDGWTATGAMSVATVDGTLVLGARAGLKGGGAGGGQLALDTTVADRMTIDFDLAVTAPPRSGPPPRVPPPPSTPAAGVEFFKTNPGDSYLQSGYRFSVQRNGDALLLDKNGVVAQATQKLSPATAQHFQIVASGGNLTVLANGAPLLQAFDQTFVHAGYLDLFVEAATARFGFFELY